MSKSTKTKSAFFAELKNDFLRFLTDKYYMVCLLLTAAGSFGFMITHYAVNIDDLEYGRYYYGELFAQGRLTATLFFRAFNLSDNLLWIQDFWGIVFLCAAAILFCVIFDRALSRKSSAAYIVFSCLFVSSPLHSELFGIAGCSLAIGAGCILIALAFLAVMYYFSSKKKIALLFAALLIIPAASWYESVLEIYICAVFAVLLFTQNENKELKLKKIITDGLIYAVPLAVGMAAEIVLSNAVMKIFNIQLSDVGTNGNIWGTLESSERLPHFIFCLRRSASCLITSFFYYPVIRLFFIMGAIFFAVILIQTIKNHRAGFLLCGAGFFLSNFIIVLLSGAAIRYRTCQSFTFTIAIIAMYFLLVLLSGSEKKSLKTVVYRALCVCFALLTFVQVNTINYYFTNDYLRYEYEKKMLTDIGDELRSNYDLSKPVVFIGKPELPEYIYERCYDDSNNIYYNVAVRVPLLNRLIKWQIPDPDKKVRVQNVSDSVINWAVNAFNEPNTSLIKIFGFLGYDEITNGTLEQFRAAAESGDEMASWPQNGSITDNGEYITVKLGDEIPVYHYGAED